MTQRTSLVLVLALALTACGRVQPGAVSAPSAALKAAAAQPVGPALLQAFDADHDGQLSPAEVAGTWLDGLAGGSAELDRAFQAQGRTADPGLTQAEGLGGVIAGGTAGVLALGLLGYLTYTGLKGSKDFMQPKKDTYSQAPSAYGWNYDAFTFKSHDNLTLAAWYIPAARPTTKGIVVFHGHGSNKDKVLMKYGAMLHERYNLFVYDQRYCGASEGAFTTLGYMEDLDAPIAVKLLKERGNDSIGLMGESMGAAVAIDTAVNVPEVKAVWADCAFDTLYDAVQPRVVARKYPLSSPVAESIITTVGLKSHCPVTQADPIKFIAKISPRPVYLVHGQKDDETTPMNGEKLFDAAREPKTMWRTPEARHAQSWQLYPEEYRSRMGAFFEAAL